MGSTRRLDNGNTIIGWGSKYPTITEVKSDGSIALELQLAPTTFSQAINNSYRALRLPWEGRPLTPPILVTEMDESNTTTLYYSWNGATDVVSYDIYAGNTLESLVLIGSETKTGFETSTTLTPTQQADNCLFQVVPIDNQDKEGIPSAVQLGEHCVETRLYFPVVAKTELN